MADTAGFAAYIEKKKGERKAAADKKKAAVKTAARERLTKGGK